MKPREAAWMAIGERIEIWHPDDPRGLAQNDCEATRERQRFWRTHKMNVSLEEAEEIILRAFALAGYGSLDIADSHIVLVDHYDVPTKNQNFLCCFRGEFSITKEASACIFYKEYDSDVAIQVYKDCHEGMFKKIRFEKIFLNLPPPPASQGAQP